MGTPRKDLKRLTSTTKPRRSSRVKSIRQGNQECCDLCQPQTEGRPSPAACICNLARRVNDTATVSKRLVLESSTVCRCILCRHILLPSHLLHPHHGYLLLQSRNRKYLQSYWSQYLLAVLCECDGGCLYLRLLYCHIQQLPEKCLYRLRT